MQATATVLLIRPANFGYNAETAASNRFQQSLAHSTKDIAEKACAEFDAFSEILKANGVHVIIMEDTPKPKKPDSIFPNNWMSCHQDGTIVLYPMLTNNRREERRKDIVDHLGENYHIKRIIDLTDFEKYDQFLEGTGSIVFDHRHRIAYACSSSRTNRDLFFSLCEQLLYKPIWFNAFDNTANFSPIHIITLV